MLHKTISENFLFWCPVLFDNLYFVLLIFLTIVYGMMLIFMLMLRQFLELCKCFSNCQMYWIYSQLSVLDILPSIFFNPILNLFS